MLWSMPLVANCIHRFMPYRRPKILTRAHSRAAIERMASGLRIAPVRASLRASAIASQVSQTRLLRAMPPSYSQTFPVGFNPAEDTGEAVHWFQGCLAYGGGMVNSAMVNADPRVSNAPVSAKFLAFWAGFRTSKTPLNISATTTLTNSDMYTDKFYAC